MAKAGFEGFNNRPSMLQDLMTRVALILSTASPGPTGPVLSVDINECNSVCGSLVSLPAKQK